MKIEELANQLIHSYIFYLAMRRNRGLTGILVASDRLRNKALLELSLCHIIKIFTLAANGEDDKPISMRYDDKKEDYIVRLASKRDLSKMSPERATE
jgi:hypothetical protein